MMFLGWQSKINCLTCHIQLWFKIIDPLNCMISLLTLTKPVFITDLWGFNHFEFGNMQC